MNKQVILNNIGGFPLEEDTLDFMQNSYTQALASVAKLCGDKVILWGVAVSGGVVSSGWIAYLGELIPFIGGSVNTKVVITNTGTDAVFEDATTHTVYFTKTATCAPVGDFDFADLIKLSALQNIWLPGDLKQKYVDGAYLAANYDVNGYGLNREVGWRIFSKAVPASAGKVLVNLDTADATFNTIGNNGGEKTHVLSTGEMPAHTHTFQAGGDTAFDYNPAGKPFGNQDDNGRLQTITTTSVGGGAAHNNLQPYFVVLTLIKL